jgi:protein TonB
MAIQDTVAVLDTKTGMARPVRRGDAIGAEIPVTVHASRSTQSLGQNLPPVHEETRTVIVLQQGAVVRLTASLTPGETVVLTNRATGADVLCRVTSVKSQPGIQHYVDLEFSQRAPGFWGDTSPAQNAPAVEAAARPSVPPVAPAQPPLASAPEPRVAANPAPAAVQHPAAQDLRPAPLAEPISAPRPVRPVDTVNAVRAPSPSPFSTDAFAQATASPLPTATLLGAESAHGLSFARHRRALLVAAASILLVAGTALGGYWFYVQQSVSSDIPAPRQFVNMPKSLAPPPVPPEANFLAADLGAAVMNSAPLPLPEGEVNAIIEAESPLEPVNRPVNRTEPPSRPDASAPLPEARRNTLAIGKLKAPAPRTLPSTPLAAEAPPMVVGAAVDLGIAGTESPLLAGAGADLAPPPGSRLAIGGQLQPPRLLSSAPPIYPANARRQRVQGEVVLDALLDETGKVAKMTVISGPVALQSAAQDAVRKWKYAPARLNGAPISVHTTVSVRFSLN